MGPVKGTVCVVEPAASDTTRLLLGSSGRARRESHQPLPGLYHLG
jgi:hypothetical protein